MNSTLSRPGTGASDPAEPHPPTAPTGSAHGPVTAPVGRHRPAPTTRALLVILGLIATLIALPATPADAAADPSAGRTAELRMIELVNQERTSRGLPALRERYDIRDVAHKWSTRMASTGDFRHNPSYTSQICCWRSISENIAYSGGRTDPRAAAEYLHQKLMNSTGHRANILGRGYREMGIGIWFDGSRMYVTQNFRQPDGTTPPAGQTPPSATAGSTPVTDAPVRSIDLACSGAPPENYPDVARTSTAARAIGCVTWWRVAGGLTDGTFRPGASISRAQMATFVAAAIERSGGTLPATSRRRFRDVSGTHAANIERLAAAGIVQGCATDRFCPSAPVTRAQMATFLALAWQELAGTALPPPPKGTVYFTDRGSGPHASNIDRIAAAGFAGGVKTGTYAPGREVSRGQMSLFLARFLDRATEKAGASPPR